MEFQHVAVGKDEFFVNALAFVFADSPDFGKLQSLGKVLVDAVGSVFDSSANMKYDRIVAIGFMARGLSIDAQKVERFE